MLSTVYPDRILLVMPLPRLVRKAVAAGFTVWSVGDPAWYAREQLQEVEQLSEELVITDRDDEPRLRRSVSETARRHRVGHVLHMGSVSTALPVLEEAERMGLAPTPPTAARVLSDIGSLPDGQPDGPRFSVETLSVDGVHHVIGIAATRTSGPPHYIETGHQFPAPLSEALETRMASMVTAMLDQAGHRTGPAHTTVVRTADGPMIIRCEPQYPGGRLPLLIEVATGFDPEAAIFSALAGRPVERTPATRYAEIGYFRLPAGHLVSVTGLEEICTLPYAHAVRFPYVRGDVLTQTPEYSTRHGYVMVSGASSDEARRRAAGALGLLRADVRGTARLSDVLQWTDLVETRVGFQYAYR